MSFGLKRVFGGRPAKNGPPNPFQLSYNDLGFLKNPAESQFGDYIKNINAPSSVDAVRGEAEGERLQNLLRGIDEDTARSMGDVKLNAEERGLGGPGIASDIEFSGLGTAATGGVRAKGDARLQAMMAELDRLSKREEASRTAYGQRYAAGVGGQSTLAQLMSSLFNSGADRELRGRTPKEKGILGNSLSKFFDSFATKSGESLGGGGADKLLAMLAGGGE